MLQPGRRASSANTLGGSVTLRALGTPLPDRARTAVGALKGFAPPGRGGAGGDFANDFSSGGWTGWLSMIINDNNNYLGYQSGIKRVLQEKVEEQQKALQTELGRDFSISREGYIDRRLALGLALGNQYGKRCSICGPNTIPILYQMAKEPIFFTKSSLNPELATTFI